MSYNLYISRKIITKERVYSEAELLKASPYVVVLAEPGAGKTELMGSLAQKLGTSVITANKFRYSEAMDKEVPLVIDAFDELAKIDSSGIHKLLSKAESCSPTHVYLSSRSSEWDNAATNAFKEFLGHQPLVVRLGDFDEKEQQEIFQHHAVGESFSEFQAEVARFDLEKLLPNPQFLKLLAEAYIESGRHFIDKRSIFAQAVDRLAREANISVARPRSALSGHQKVDLSSEVFAKLLLAGAEGIGTSEATESRMYPLLTSLVSGNNAAEGILATRLFKPGDSADQHRPVHKIVSEYCAADYLTKRIADPADHLTLSDCLPIIAPNSAVRDELRGLLGWMASLGNQNVQESAITLDPYAVLANGDPSQLFSSSRRLLLSRLKDAEEDDPYFRRGDVWRRFSVAGFFTSEVIEDIKPILATNGDGHLRDLILELLAGSSAIAELSKELRQIVLNKESGANARVLANRCLLELAERTRDDDFDLLIIEASSDSLQVVAEAIEALGVDTFDPDYLAKFFQACASLYPGRNGRGGHTGSRYFVKELIGHMDLASIESILDSLTEDLVCRCGKHAYECECRIGISKVVGSMLDRYFELAKSPFDPIRIWRWTGSLRFYEQKTSVQSKSVQVLQDNSSLRQGIIGHALGRLTEREQINDVRFEKFHWNCHSGLYFWADDYRFIADLAFHGDNPALWGTFITGHHQRQVASAERSNPLRRHLRSQAREKRSFMREWARSQRGAKEFEQKHRVGSLSRRSRMARARRKQDEVRVANIKYVRDNRGLVESGNHWGCLVRFADLVLKKPDQIESEFGDEVIVRNALRNCLHFIAPEVPDLLRLAELQCASQGLYVEDVLYAACLEVMREKGHLEGVDLDLLRALRTNLNMHYSAVPSEDVKALKAEVDRLVFPDEESCERFIREYVEPQLACTGCSHPEVGLLRSDKIFRNLRPKLSIEWLKRFRDLAFGALDTLFEIAAEHGDRRDLESIIEDRCAELHSISLSGRNDLDQSRKFWYVRAWLFLPDAPSAYWRWLAGDQETIHLLCERSGRLRQGNHPHWPALTTIKVADILDAYVEKWPEVDSPNHSGSGSPREENAYRFLTEVIWSIGADDCDDAIPVLDRLLADVRLASFRQDLKSIRASQVRKKSLRDFEPPTPCDVVNRLDRNVAVTVEGVRQLVIEELQDFQRAIDGGEFDSADRFYEKEQRIGEVACTQIIAERLSLKLRPLNINVTPEHQLKDAKRSDFTVAKLIGGKRRLLVTEVKGQWHKDLYTAVSAQLQERYSIHPDAEQQGIFLVLWYGKNEYVAGRKVHGITSAKELKHSIEATLPSELKGLIDVFVLDVSRNS